MGYLLVCLSLKHGYQIEEDLLGSRIKCLPSAETHFFSGKLTVHFKHTFLFPSSIRKLRVRALIFHNRLLILLVLLLIAVLDAPPILLFTLDAPPILLFTLDAPPILLFTLDALLCQ
jgi:hypothetical protein